MKQSYDEVMAIFNTDDYEGTKSAALEVLEQAKVSKDYTYMCKLYYLLGYISEYSDDFGMAIIYYLEGSRYGQLSTDSNIHKTVISIHKNLATVLGDFKHYQLAYKFIDEGVEIAQAHSEEKQVESLLNNKIHELLEEENYIMALNLIDSMRISFPNLSESRRVALNNKEGVAYHNLGQLDKAVLSYQKVIDDSESYGLAVYAICQQNIGSIYHEKGNLSEAVGMFRKSIEYCKSNNYGRWLFEGYQHLGETYVSLNVMDSALFYFLKAIELVERGDQDAVSYEVYQLISQVYSEKGDFKTALKYKELYSLRLENYISQQEKITEDNQKYNIQLLTDRYFDLLAADKDQKDTERMAKFGISGTAFIFLSILLAMLYRQRKTKQSLARELNLLELESDV